MLRIILFLLKMSIVISVLFLLIKIQTTWKIGIKKIIKKIGKNELLVKIVSNKLFRSTRANFIKLGIDFNVYTVLGSFIISIVVSILVCNISFLLFKIKSVAFILSFPQVFITFWLISYIANKKQDKLERIMSDFFIQLKGALKTGPDITEAFKRIQDSCMEPFKEYIKSFLNEVNAGKLPEEALCKLADKVDIKRFSLYINNLKYCSIYGGNIESLTIETQKLISELLVQKKKRKKETQSICMVLYGLILIDIVIYFNLVINNVTYLNLMKESLTGNFIVNLNFLSIWLVIWFANLVKKLDF